MDAHSSKRSAPRGHKRLVMLDFVVVDRFHCGASFPYLQGRLCEMGIQTAILSIGLEAALAFAGSGDDGAVVDAEALLFLAQHAATFEPTNLLFSHKPSEKAVTFLQSKGDFEIAHMDESAGSVITAAGRKVPLGSWLGFDDELGEGLLSSAYGVGDFRFVPINELSRSHRPLPHIFCGPECLFRRPISNSIHYKNVPLAGCIRTSGCSFCLTSDSARQNEQDPDPFELLARHLVGAAETIDWRDHKPRYRIVGHGLFPGLDRFAEVVSEMELNPSDFLFSCRADDIVRNVGSIEAGLTSMRETGHVVCLALVGIESFAHDELERLGKGFAVAVALRAIKALFELEDEYKGVFDFKSYGGFSTILYTPWTTLENIELNLEIVRLAGIEDVCGKLLGSRLRLYESLPIYRLARTDGLIVGSYDDRIFDTANRNFYPPEVPWKFADKRAKLACRLLSRFQIDESLEGDQLYKNVQDWLDRSFDPDTSRVEAALVLLDRIKNTEDLAGADEVLASDVKKRESAMAPEPAGWRTAGARLERDAPDFSFERYLFETGNRRVGKLEYVPLDRRDEAVRSVEAGLGSGLRFRALDAPDVPDSCHLLYGFEGELLKEAVDLSSDVMKRASKIDFPAAVFRIGVLYGYPKCCAMAYSEATAFEMTFNEWMHLANRANIDGAVERLMNPFCGYIRHVPCSLTCVETLETITAYLDHAARGDGQMQGEGSKILDWPILYRLDSPGRFAVLKPSGLRELDGRFELDYELAHARSSDEGLGRLRSGDRLEIRPGQIAVKNGPENVGSFVMDAALWWHERSFHSDFWKACFELAVSEDSRANTRIRQRPGSPRGTGELEPYSHREKKALLKRLAAKIDERTGYRFKSAYYHRGKTHAIFDSSLSEVELQVFRADRDEDSFLSGDRFAISYVRGTELDERGMVLARLVLEIFERYGKKKELAPRASKRKD